MPSTSDSGAPAPAATPERILDALADLVDGGQPLGEAIAAVARIGPGSRAFAGKLALLDVADAQGARGKPQPQNDSEKKSGLPLPERKLLGLFLVGDARAQLGSALRLLATRRRDRAALSATARKAGGTPFLILLATALLTPLVDLLGSGSYLHDAAVNLGWLALATFLVAVVGPRLLAHPSAGAPLRAVLARLPFAGSLLRLDEETALCAALAAFTDGKIVAPAAFDAAACLAKSPQRLAALARARAATDGGTGALRGEISEALSLALLSGASSGRQKAALRELHDETLLALLDRVRSLFRALTFAIVIASALLTARAILSHPLPGLGGGDNAGGSEMKDLEKMLEEIQN